MEKFDPQTHKFGMAYYLPDGAIYSTWVYPIFKQGNKWLCADFARDRRLYDLVNVTRATEYDLIPVSVADKLAVTLRAVLDNLNEGDFISTTRLDNAEAALKEYEARK